MTGNTGTAFSHRQRHGPLHPLRFPVTQHVLCLIDYDESLIRTHDLAVICSVEAGRVSGNPTRRIYVDFFSCGIFLIGEEEELDQIYLAIGKESGDWVGSETPSSWVPG